MLLLIVALVVFTSATFMLLARKEVINAMFNAEEESARNVLKLVMLQIENEYNDLLYYRKSSLELHKKQLKDIITLQEAAIRKVYERVKQGAQGGHPPAGRTLYGAVRKVPGEKIARPVAEGHGCTDELRLARQYPRTEKLP